MVQISLDEIQRDFMGCLQRVAPGETLVIVLGNTPLAEIKPLQQDTQQPRPCGLCKGDFVVPDDFDEPLPGDFLNEFEGK